jgi:hypothetical protein
VSKPALFQEPALFQKPALYQGTTLVVPINLNKEVGL